ncbi:class I SAM-dependent methyltransferase [uncultured Aquimarina sp.]|uniref:class I SAM-dependent methyltransferase n=1 Tax=uncultured Aquimarina sp. TaxID=575652 RepID=UPI00260BF439|nr:class I SAM-dependent methyltransferase [uncultured Aquimarina sp.]
MKRVLKKLLKDNFFTAPKKMQQKHTTFSKEQLEELTKSLKENYLDRGNTKSRLSTAEYNQAVSGQLFDRLYYNRNRIAPWLHRVKDLNGANILEIGCGTGISTLALSEQGAKVVGVDVDAGALEVAKDRMRIAGYEAELHHVNGEEIEENFKDRKFDFIIYYAVLEHMTVSERLESLQQAWRMLSSGGYLAIIETPNRLWYYDSHTAALPFYDWLPDDLAYYYSKFSSRKNFKDSYREIDDENMMKFKRWGRGASYHEFEVAIAPLKEINIVSSLMKFEKSAFLKVGFKGLRYIKFLKSMNKNLNSGFCYPYLDIVIKK